MKREKGDRYRPIVTVKKLKGNVPSVIEVSGRRYVYTPHDVNSRRGKK